ncbi:MAG: hypothetical protein OXG08_04530 [Gammaproteobacteria bacterium]|nr:hypothetical protein [Gammaproteobacteria bacterium]
MSPNYLLPVLAAFLVCSTAFADEPEKPTRKSESEEHRWFFTFAESSFSRNAGITVHNIPEGTDAYSQTINILSPRFAVGYRLAESKWSCELQLQLGPRESFEATRGGEVLSPAAKVDSRFLSLSANRMFTLRNGYEIEAKIGVVDAFFKNRVQVGPIEREFSFSEIKPMASLGLHKRFNRRFSAGFEFTNYFLSRTGSVTTSTFGLRYHF